MIRAVMICVVTVMFSGQLAPCLAQVLQRVEIPSSLNPVGSGARALGMGGAFIAVADDATAASWNPGGLIQLETPEISVVGALFSRSEDNTFGSNPEASGVQRVSEQRINYLSVAYPFNFRGRNMIISANYQNLFDFTREWRFPLNLAEGNLALNQVVDSRQKGSLSAIGLAYCVQLTPVISLGLTFNFWDDPLYGNEWEQTTRQNGAGTFVGYPFTFTSENFDRYSFDGFNVNLGLLWVVNSHLTIGAVLKTPFTADLVHESRDSSMLRFTTLPIPPSTSATRDIENEKLDMPMSYGVGVAYRISDNLTVSLDIYRTEWGDYVLIDSKGNKTSPISGRPFAESDVDPTHQIRTGAEYLFIKDTCVIPLRGGVFYDPAPAEGSPDDFYGFSLGSGIAYKRVVFDVAYQYRFGRDVGSSIMSNLGFSQDIDEHTLYGSVIIHF